MGNTTSSNNVDINNTEYLSGGQQSGGGNLSGGQQSGGQPTEVVDAQEKLDFTAAHYILTKVSPMWQRLPPPLRLAAP